ncbi:hypothetical protein ACFL5X_03895, partial [Candidatus Omnitrophota bacterium]
TIVQAPFSPQTLNRYSYCQNNPINLVDPSGHWSWKNFWKSFVGAFVGVATAIVLGPAMGAMAAGAIGGALGGAITGGLHGGWKGALIGAAIGGALGGLGGWASGIKGGGWIIGGMVLGGAAYAGVTDSWDSFAGGLAGGLAGAAVGGAINSAGQYEPKILNQEAFNEAQQEAPQFTERISEGYREGGVEGGMRAAVDTLNQSNKTVTETRDFFTGKTRDVFVGKQSTGAKGKIFEGAAKFSKLLPTGIPKGTSFPMMRIIKYQYALQLEFAKFNVTYHIDSSGLPTLISKVIMPGTEVWKTTHTYEKWIPEICGFDSSVRWDKLN